MTAREDDVLIEAASRGDAAAWSGLVDRHLQAVIDFSWYKLGDRAAAEDIAQDVFVRLMKKAPNWEPGGPTIRAWLFRVAMNLCIDRMRAKPMLALETVDYVPLANPAPEADIDDRIAWQRAVRAAIDDLPERQQTAIVLVHYQGLSNKEAADLLEVSVEALESLLSRARRKMRKRLDPLKAELMEISS